MERVEGDQVTKAKPAATYLYCIVHGKFAPALRGVPKGLPGMKAPRLLDAGKGLRLVVGDAPLSLYAAQPIEDNLQDLEWVAERAMAHEQVIEYFARSGTVIPMKLFTLFSSDERAVADIQKVRADLDRTVARIGGCQEWGIRIRLDPKGAASVARSGTKGSAKGVAKASSGTQFLLLKKKEKDLAAEIRNNAAATADMVYRELARYGKDSKRIPAVQDESNGRVILDAAFLVAGDRLKAFRAAVQALIARVGRAYDISLSGPWPPYNFVSAVR